MPLCDKLLAVGFIRDFRHPLLDALAKLERVIEVGKVEANEGSLGVGKKRVRAEGNERGSERGKQGRGVVFAELCSPAPVNQRCETSFRTWVCTSSQHTGTA